MKKSKKWNSMRLVAMFLVMVLTFTQIPAVPTAAEDFTENMFQEVELFQDGSDADVVPEPVTEAANTVPEAAEEATVDTDIIQEPEVFQDGAEAVSVELFSAGEMETTMPVLTSGEENKQYHLNYDYIGTIGNGAMLPNNTMTIFTHLIDCTNNGWSEVTGYTLEVQPLGLDYNNEFQASVDGTNIVITSSDETGWFVITVKFLLNGEEIYTDTISFGISKYVLTPETIIDENGNKLNLAVGESIDLSQVGFALQEYRDGNLYMVEDTSKYRIEVSMGTMGDGNTWCDYDIEGWNLQEVSGQDLPIMTRTTENSTWFALTVMLKESDDSWNQVARRQYFFESLYEGDNGEDAGGEDDDEWHNDFSEGQSNYELWIDFADTIGNGAMLPNSQMTIVTDLRDKTDDYSEISDYQLKIETQSKYGEATVSSDGKNLVITSKDKTGYGYCYVSVQIPDGNGGYQEVFKKDVPFSVSQYMLTPGALVDENGNELNPEKGESIDLSKVGFALQEYKDGQLSSVDASKYRIIVYVGEDEDGNVDYDYDTYGWDMEKVSGQDLPIMTRTTENGTWFAVTVLWKEAENSWNQVARRNYFFDEIEHEHTWGEWEVRKEATYTTAGVKLRFCTECGEAETEEIARVTIPTPTLTSATATAYNKITFKWKAVSGVDGYRIYRKTEGSSSWKPLAYVTSDKTSYVDSKAVSGTEYTYTVKAYCNNGSSKVYSGYDKTGKSAVTKAKAPTLSSAKATAGNQITFTWKAVSGVDGYRVYRKIGNGSYKALAYVSSGKTSYVDKTVKAGSSYTYTVRAYHNVGGSELLGYYNSTGKTATAKAAAPTLSSAKATAGNQITFTWKKVSGADGYCVLRKTGSGSYKTLAYVSSSKTSYVDKTVKAGTTYTYTVKAYNTVNGSELLGYYKSTGKTVTAKAKAPTLSSVSALGSGKVKVTWKKLSGVDGYCVYRKTAKGSWTKIATVSSSTTSYTDKTAKAGTKYYYTVKAYNTVNGSKLIGFYNTTGKVVTAK